MNLNDAVSDNCKSDFANRGISMELSEDIRREYDDDLFHALYLGIGNLTFETQKYRKGKIKVVTKVETSKEILEIYSEGEPLTERVLTELNRNYQYGSQLIERPLIYGSRIAAFFLAKVGGKVSIENCDIQPYTVRNSVVFKR